MSNYSYALRKTDPFLFTITGAKGAPAGFASSLAGAASSFRFAGSETAETATSEKHHEKPSTRDAVDLHGLLPRLAQIATDHSVGVAVRCEAFGALRHAGASHVGAVAPKSGNTVEARSRVTVYSYTSRKTLTTFLFQKKTSEFGTSGNDPRGVAPVSGSYWERNESAFALCQSFHVR